MKLLDESKSKSDSIIIVHKPYMERRTYATAKKLFPDKEFIITSPAITFEEYPNDQIDQELMINIMVGDLQRIMEYPAKGFQIPMEVPRDVKTAYEFLVKAGYDKHLIK